MLIIFPHASMDFFCSQINCCGDSAGEKKMIPKEINNAKRKGKNAFVEGMWISLIEVTIICLYKLKTVLKKILGLGAKLKKIQIQGGHGQGGLSGPKAKFEGAKMACWGHDTVIRNQLSILCNLKDVGGQNGMLQFPGGTNTSACA